MLVGLIKCVRAKHIKEAINKLVRVIDQGQS